MTRRLVAAFTLLVVGLLALAGQAFGVRVVPVSESKLTVDANLSPTGLPRSRPAPVALHLSEKLDSETPAGDPNLRVWIELGRDLSFNFVDLRTCRGELWELGTPKLRRICRRAIVGMGSVTVLSNSGEQISEPLTVINLGLRGHGGNRADYLELHFPVPEAPPSTPQMKVRRIDGRYGLRLAVRVLGSNFRENSIQGIDFTLFRRFSAGGRRHSFVNSTCSHGAVPMRVSLEYLSGGVERQGLTLPCRPTAR